MPILILTWWLIFTVSGPVQAEVHDATDSHAAPLSHPSYSAFTYSDFSPLYATAVPRATRTTSYAAPFASYSSFISLQSYTIWSSVTSPTDVANRYGNVAWTKQWSYRYVTPPPINTTVTATPVVRSELVKPNSLPLPTGDPSLAHLKLPKGFIWGFAGAAAQIEGASATEGRGPFAFELYLRNLYGTAFQSPDISNLNYFYYREDFARLAAAGVQSYSFSIAWPRILPFGVKGSPINQQAIDHYNDVINACLEYSLTPIVTLVHFDTPLHFLTNTSVFGYDHPDFLESFIFYGKLVMAHYADRVPIWVTFNEPNADALFGNYASSANILQGHAQVTRFYRETLKGKGKVTLKMATIKGFGVPLDPSNPEDVRAASRWNDYQYGILSNPLYLGIDIPQSVRDTLPASVLPQYSAAELATIRGTSDFYSIDAYESIYVTSPANSTIEACTQNPKDALYPQCVLTNSSRNGWPIGYQGNGASAAIISHEHTREHLNFIWNTYKPCALAITEFGFNGFGEANKSKLAQRENLPQSVYYLAFLNEMLKAIHFDNINIIGAIGWAYVDNWEWGGYAERYGVQINDQTTQQRQYKRTIFDFVDWFRAHES